MVLKVSTISIAEYCLLGELEDLPLKNVQILPFNLKDAEKTGEFAKIIYLQNNINVEKLSPRAIIPNDSKLFDQSHVDKTVSYFVTSDVHSRKTWTLLKNGTNPKFDIISIDIPYSETFGILDF